MLVHPQEPAFQRLIFITMLAWENPYREDLANGSEKASFQVHSSDHLFKFFNLWNIVSFVLLSGVRGQ